MVGAGWPAGWAGVRPSSAVPNLKVLSFHCRRFVACPCDGQCRSERVRLGGGGNAFRWRSFGSDGNLIAVIIIFLQWGIPAVISIRLGAVIV